MKAAGLKTPVPWFHAPEAVPAFDEEWRRKAFYLSRMNAGYAADIDVGPEGELVARMDVPGCEVDGDNLTAWHEEKGEDGVWRRRKTAIADVSVSVGDFTDGQGRKWKNVIKHIALTPTPVAHGHGGFSKAADLGFTLSLGMREMAMDDVDVDETPSGKPDPAPAPAQPAAPQYFGEALQWLRKKGLPLLPDTTPANLLERICVGCHAQMNAEGEDDMNGDDEGAEYDGRTQEEPRPVMMSLNSPDLTEWEKKLLAKEERKHKAGLKVRIEKLRDKAAVLTKDEAAEMLARLEAYTLSVDGEGEPVAKALDRELSIWERAAARVKGADQLLKTATTQPNPVERAARRPVSEEAIKKRAAAVSSK